MSVPPLVPACAAAGSAIAAGVYTVFSVRVMPRLARLPQSESITTMQAFNRAAVQPPFMIVFFGSAVASLWTLFRCARQPRTLADGLGVTGSVLYLAGFALTIAYNVPRNRLLDTVTPGTTRAGEVWTAYLREWTAANSIRALLSVAAAAALAGCSVLALLGDRSAGN